MTPPPQPDALLRVMIVDDNRDAADSLAMLLQFEGQRTLCAYSGEQALQDVHAQLQQQQQQGQQQQQQRQHEQTCNIS